MSNQSDPQWLSWIAPLVAAGGVIWAAARRLLISVTREELAALLKEAEEEREARRLQLHHENIAKFDKLFDRLGDVENEVSEIRGHLSR